MVSAWRNTGSNRNWFRDISGYIYDGGSNGLRNLGDNDAVEPNIMR